MTNSRLTLNERHRQGETIVGALVHDDLGLLAGPPNPTIEAPVFLVPRQQTLD